MTWVLVPLLTALLTAAAFPPFEMGWAAFAALLPLLLSTGRGGGGRRDLLLGWLSGWAASTAVVWWVINTVIHYGHIPPLVAVPLLLLMTWAMGLFWGVFAWARGRVLRRRPGAVVDLVVSPALWVALEYLRARLPDIAFPWALLGYSQFLSLHLIQAADLFGVWAVSFLVVVVNCALASLLSRRAASPGGIASRVLPAAAAAALLAAAWAYGAFRLSTPAAGVTMTVAVAQGNIEQDVKWDPAYKRSTFDLYASLTEEAASRGAGLVVWPETAAPFFYMREPRYRQEISALASRSGVAVLFGAPAMEGRGKEATLRNRAYLVGSDGTLRGWYDKVHLVPFGEYVPWRRVLFFVDKLVQAVGEFSPGAGPVVMEAPAGRFGTLICYEVIFPDLARRSVEEGAQFLVNITNDAWFGLTAASRQHFSTLVFRAVENRRPVVRAANTGISGFVDRSGRIVKDSGLFVRGVYEEAITPEDTRTLYTRVGDLFPQACLLAAAAALALALRRAREASAAASSGRRSP